MKKALNIFIIMLMTFSIFSVFGLIDTTKGAWQLMSNFDDVASGLDSGTSGLFEFESVGYTDQFETSSSYAKSEPNSFKCHNTGGLGSGYLNLTSSFSYIGLINFSFRAPGGGDSDSFVWFLFYDSENNIAIRFVIGWSPTGGNNAVTWYDDVGGTKLYDFNYNFRFTMLIEHNGTNYFNVKTYNSSWYLINETDINGNYSGNWDTFTSLKLDHGGGSSFGVYIDNFYIDTTFTPPGGGTNETGDTIYFQLYNIEDGKAIQYGDFSEIPEIVTWPFVISSIIPTGYAWDIVDGKIKITDITFTEGEIYTFYFSGENDSLTTFAYWYYWRDGREVDPVKKYFSPKTYNQAIYNGETYNIYLYPTDYTDGVDYGWYEDNEYIEIALNKKIYDFGETVRCKFRFKSQKMLNNGLPAYNWQLRMVKRTDMIMNVLASTPFVNYLRQDAGDFDFHNDWQRVQWQLIEHNDYGYKKYYAKYLCAMFHPWKPFGSNYNLCKIPFWCTGEEFTPSGSISANPNPCTMGQIVTISWTANNSGKVKIASPFSTDGNPNYVKSQPFEYGDATRYFNFTPSVIGNYNVELYVDGIETGNASNMPVDTLTLKVNPKTGDEGEHGQFGFGVAYLWIPSYRLVAGLDNVSIYYRTYRNDSQLFVYSPRNETTSYSTTCSNWSDNVHNFHIENWMQIGTWNVTFLAGHLNGTNITLRSSFNIINEEGNWIQFGKNVYYDNENFNLWLKHDYRISLTFYKNDVAQGQDITFGKGEHDGEEIYINPQYVKPSPGFWRVEMNRINELNRIYKLAEWTCTVKPAPISTTATGTFGYNLQTFMLNIDPTIRAIMGIGLCISLLLIPLGVTMKMKRPINIPPIVYAIFFLVGVGVSYIIYLWGLELMFFLCSMTALVLVGLYIMGKQKSAPAEA